jgi:predicted lactoylglutathione lyase
MSAADQEYSPEPLIMKEAFPSAVPEIPVTSVTKAAEYYERCLGFNRDWGEEDGGIGQVSRGSCRLFLTDPSFREQFAKTSGPVVIWLNLDSKQEVDELYEAWHSRGARIVSKPESKPWHLHEFTAADMDGNFLRVFYDFAWELPDRGGRP